MEYKEDVMKIGKLYDIEKARQLGGIVDYVVGTPLTKFYVLAEHPDPKQQHYLSLYKMGEGPLYPFFHPYHLVHFEVPNSIARVVLFRDQFRRVGREPDRFGEVLPSSGKVSPEHEARFPIESPARGDFLDAGLCSRNLKGSTVGVGPFPCHRSPW